MTALLPDPVTPLAPFRTATPTRRALALVPPITHPPVSVFMAVRNEAHELEASVTRILAQEYVGEFELVLAVGTSTDETWEVAARLAQVEPRLRVVQNPVGHTPAGLNAAIAAAQHDILVRVDGHAFIPPGYLADVVHLLQTSGAANVGGRMVPEGEGPVSRAIAITMSSRFGIGGGAFHVGGAAGPQPTVYLGAFRREAVAAVGGYDEKFLRAQDWELNHRLRQAGYTVWFEPALGVVYRPRASWQRFAAQQFRTGGWRRRVIQTHQGTASARYLAPPAAVLAILIGLVAGAPSPFLWDWLALGFIAPLGYLAGVIAAGFFEGRRQPWSVRWRLPIALAVMHLSWGSGFLVRAP
jgi:succinoglycan biosynthesis protein ExoA